MEITNRINRSPHQTGKAIRHWRAILATALSVVTGGCGGSPLAIEPAMPHQDPASVVASADDDVEHNHGALRRVLQASWRSVVREIDRDRDGNISSSEVSWAPDTFRELDRNGNGLLAPDELQLTSGRLEQMTELVHNAYQQIFRQADRNHDGRLSQAEIDASEELLVFQKTPGWISLVGQYGLSAAPLTQTRFESFMMDLLQRTDEQRQGEPPLRNLGGKTPVLLVQGYMEPSWYFLSGIYLFLKKRDWPVFAINLFPNIGDIREQARLVKNKVDEILKQTGTRRINLVVHSMGGLISRYYIQNLEGVQVVDKLVTIATPHYGTYAALVGIGHGARQMEPGSEFLRLLNGNGGIYPPVRYTSVWTPTDEIVIPAKSAELQGSDIRSPVTMTGHLLILFDRRTYQHIWSTITGAS